MADIPKVDLVGVGLNATDTLIPVPHFPERGSKVEIHSAEALLGGQVASAVAACQKWGLRTRYIGKLGEDHAALLHRQEFERLDVETHLFIAPTCPSQQAFILVDPTGERTVLWKRDARLTLKPKELRREWVVNARALHVDGHDTGAATQAAQWAREAGVPTFADVDNLYPGYELLLPNIDFLITSRDCPGRITHEPDPRISLPEIHRRYGCRLTGATLGQNGVLAWDGQCFCYAPAYVIDPVDTTGAGDTFHAGFIYAFLQGWPLQRQLEFACAAAALNCTAVGARGGIRPVATIEQFMANNPKHPAAF